jgi:hypothetical protein
MSAWILVTEGGWDETDGEMIAKATATFRIVELATSVA